MTERARRLLIYGIFTTVSVTAWIAIASWASTGVAVRYGIASIGILGPLAYWLCSEYLRPLLLASSTAAAEQVAEAVERCGPAEPDVVTLELNK